MQALFGMMLWLIAAVACAADPVWRSEMLGDDVEAEIATFAADGRYLVLWITPGYGLRDQHLAFAAGFADAGMALWMTDLAEAQFLPRDRNAPLRIDPELVADLVALANRRSGKPVVLMGTGSTAIAVLRGARAWQARGGSDRTLIAAVLLSPSLYRGVPALGTAPDYLPIVGATRLPVAVLQSGKRPGAQRLDALAGELARGGSQVYAQSMPELGALFAKDVGSEPARAALAALPARVRRLLPLLEQTAHAPGPVPLVAAPVTTRPSLDTTLKPFTGRPMAAAIALSDIAGENWRVDDYRGRVTLINFWASWCPPCVEEIPSLSRLQKAMDPASFRLISIDLGEDPAVIRAFLKRVEVDFPVLLDGDGGIARAWQVIGLPSTFVVGPDGHIRFGVNGAIEWNAPAIIEQLRELARVPAQ